MNVAISIEDNTRFNLTAGRAYIIRGEYRDLLDDDDYINLKNDGDVEVTVLKSRFHQFREMTRKDFAAFNRKKKKKS